MRGISLTKGLIGESQTTFSGATRASHPGLRKQAKKARRNIRGSLRPNTHLFSNFKPFLLSLCSFLGWETHTLELGCASYIQEHSLFYI